jgi:cyanophycin synthetase
VLVDLESLDGTLSTHFPGFAARLCAALPALGANGERGGSFARRLPEGVCLAETVGRVLSELQREVGLPGDFVAARPLADAEYRYLIVCHYRLEPVAQAAVAVAADAVTRLCRAQPARLGAGIQALRRLAHRCAQGLAVQPRADVRIPIVAITGTNGKTTTTLLIARALQESGLTTGVATTEGITIGGQPIEEGDCTGYWAARKVLSTPEVQAAALETARGGILKRGLGFERCDVAVVLNVQEDHIGQDGIRCLRDLAAIKQVLATAARRAVVLNAEDPLCTAMARCADPAVEIIYFSRNADHPVVAKHLAHGGRAVVRRLDGAGAVCALVTGSRSYALVPLAELPCTLGGRAIHNEQNVLAAAAACWAMDLPREAITRALRGFVSDASGNPLRLNFFRGRGVTVLFDYAHNAAGYHAIVQTARALAPRRLAGVVAVPSDRHPDSIREIGRLCGLHFDRLVLSEMDDRRGRPVGQAAEWLRRGVLASGFDAGCLDVAVPYRQAMRRAFSACAPGDLLVLGCADDLAGLRRTLPDLEEFVPGSVKEGAGSP